MGITMVIKHKKLTIWFLVLHILCMPVESDSFDTTWEHYIPMATISLLAGVYGYSLISPNQDLKNQSQCKYWSQDFADIYKIYYPEQNSILDYFYQNALQTIANETQVPVLAILESHVKHDSEYIDTLFEHVQSLESCIVYIEKDMSKFTDFSFDRFNEFVDDTTGVFESSCSCLVDRLNQLKEDKDHSIVMLGAGLHYDRQSVYDLSRIGFNIMYEKPSYKERIEFLQLLLSHRSHFCN